MRTTSVSLRSGAMGLVIAVAVVACGGSGVTDTTVPVDTSAIATTTTGSSTSTQAGSSTTTPSVTSSIVATTAPSGDTNDLANGSGCKPGDGVLPDGDWFGYAMERAAGSLEFDLACWFDGDAAIQAAAEDGEESPPPNDYYVRNVNEQTRQVPVGDGVEVVFYPDGDPSNETTVEYGEWDALVVERGYELGVWIVVEEGEISGITEQWVP
jgi:hypothetical protein